MLFFYVPASDITATGLVALDYRSIGVVSTASYLNHDSRSNEKSDKGSNGGNDFVCAHE
ncbi:MAG: hypothetical protein JF599_11330 [Verrucomicrobia bacterium]|nr:hypothetical protein [Verrucomicrobiota bacterium]